MSGQGNEVGNHLGGIGRPSASLVRIPHRGTSERGQQSQGAVHHTVFGRDGADPSQVLSHAKTLSPRRAPTSAGRLLGDQPEQPSVTSIVAHVQRALTPRCRRVGKPGGWRRTTPGRDL